MSQGEHEVNTIAHRFNPSGPGNLAVQNSVMEFLDEFTDIISGELRYLAPIEDLSDDF